jgi:hypothetical protein
MTTVDGYLVLGPSQGVVDQAIDQRAAGVNLAKSDAFRALLPDNGHTDCSALVYRDLDALINAVPDDLLEQVEIAGAFGEGMSTGLVCVFGGEDRITASATGGSLLGIGSVLGLASAIGDVSDVQAEIDQVKEIAASTTDTAVSSLG